MKKKILIFVHTEYHLLLAVNQLLRLYNDKNLFQVELFVRRGKDSKRLNQSLDFSDLPCTVIFFDEEISIYKNLSDSVKSSIENLKDKKTDVFIFFQENDPLMVILSSFYFKNGTDVCLYQDGLKPYVNLQFHSLGLLKHEHLQNLWMRKNGFSVNSWFSPIWSKKFAFLKGITKVYLTFPEAYNNWNKKHLEKIEMIPLNVLNPVLKKLYVWDDTLLPIREKVILYMNQPMHDDGIAETEFLIKLNNKFPGTLIYVKLHPLTNEIKLNRYKTVPSLRIIQSQIPAELFHMNLKDSIILSVNSTSMFLNNPENKYYYLYKIFDKEIKRLSRYVLKGTPSSHISLANSLNDIIF